MKKTHFIIFLFVLCLYSCRSEKCYLIAFTHPYSQEKIEGYIKPNEFYDYIASDDEAGWIVEVLKKKRDFFYVKLPADCTIKRKYVWLKKGDIGMIIQNYGLKDIPIYEQNDTSSNLIGYIQQTEIGQVYDIGKQMVLLKVYNKDKIIKGWIKREYLCGNPYTTCN